MPEIPSNKKPTALSYLPLLGFYSMKLHCFDNIDALNYYFVPRLTSILQSALDARGHAYLVVPGGSSPIKLFNHLAEIDLDWKLITIVLTDERCISTLEQESNEKTVKDNLLKKFASKANFISLSYSASEIITTLETLEGSISQLPTFDAVILGMGEDGHVASLFSCAQEISMGLSDKASPAIIQLMPLSAPYKRISMTKNRLLNSRVMFLYLLGEKKYEVIKRGVAQNNPLTMPVCAFLHAQDINIEIMYARTI